MHTRIYASCECTLSAGRVLCELWAIEWNSTAENPSINIADCVCVCMLSVCCTSHLSHTRRHIKRPFHPFRTLHSDAPITTHTHTHMHASVTHRTQTDTDSFLPNNTECERSKIYRKKQCELHFEYRWGMEQREREQWRTQTRGGKYHARDA